MPKTSPEDHRVNGLRGVCLILAAILASVFIFLADPRIDLWATGLFFDPTMGFPLAQSPTFNFLRQAYINFCTAFVLLSLTMLLTSAFVKQRIHARVWVFVTSALLLGPLLLANVILKDNWGRARPAQIEAFGGEATYSPPFVMVDECARNCSFVSGEGSAISMVFILIGFLFWRDLRRWRFGGVIVVLGTIDMLFGAGLRVAMGRHFLSDTVFAILFSALIVACLYLAMKMRGPLQTATLANLGQDLADIVRRPIRRLSGAPRKPGNPDGA